MCFSYVDATNLKHDLSVIEDCPSPRLRSLAGVLQEVKVLTATCMTMVYTT